MDYIDDMMSDLRERENRERLDNRQDEIPEVNPIQKKILVGCVEHFFDKLSVAAIRLTGRVKVGDTIAIENENKTVKLKVSSMQIDKRDVESALDGDDVGIKVNESVSTGSKVYVMG